MTNASPETNQQQDIDTLTNEVRQLRRVKQAFNVYNELMDNFVTLAPRSSGNLLLRAILRQIIEISTKITKAEESSLFWLDDNGIVTESILARGVTIKEEKHSVIGQVLEKGLAGWVYRQREIGLIEDTENDERWIELPMQPYSTRSVLCIPIVRGNHLLAILTLMHSQPQHFDTELVKVMEICTQQMAFVLAQLHFYLDRLESPRQVPFERSTIPPDTLPTVKTVAVAQDLRKLGMFMITNNGKFLYADHRLAEIFHYTLSELVALESFFALITQDEFQRLIEQINEVQTQYIGLQLRGVAKNSQLIKVEFSGRKTKIFGKYVVIGMIRSLTDS